MNKDIHVVVEHLRGQVADITYIMFAAARNLAQTTGGRVIAWLLSDHGQSLAADLPADRVFYTDHPALARFTSDAYLEVLTAAIETHPPRVVLLGHTSMGMDVASGLSARLGIPIVSQCLKFNLEAGRPKFTSQICGGKLMVEGELPGPATVVTMVPGGYKAEEVLGDESPEILPFEAPQLENLQITLVQYVEPEAGDVDISQQSVLVGVGRGLQNPEDLELVEELAALLGGAVCASRPIVDLGWLPATRLVGKSGKKVKPLIYLALGISGAPEHMEGISDCKVMIAINTDPDAPIFNVAQYGAEVDMLDLIEALNEKIRPVLAA